MSLGRNLKELETFAEQLDVIAKGVSKSVKSAKSILSGILETDEPSDNAPKDKADDIQVRYHKDKITKDEMLSVVNDKSITNQRDAAKICGFNTDIAKFNKKIGEFGITWIKRDKGRKSVQKPAAVPIQNP